MIGGIKAEKCVADSEAGFTLVEVLVALALFSLLTTLLFSNLRLGLQAWQSGSAHSELLARSSASQDLLRRLIGHAYPMLVAGGGNPTIDFEGARETVSFLGDAPSVAGGAGRFRFKLFQERKQDQTDFFLSSIPELANPQDSSLISKSLLLADIDHVEFSYSNDKAKGETAWRETWSKRSELPKLVRVRVVFRSGDTRPWPDLVIAPRIGADVSCIYDPITGRCRGR
jgi:general secretion pathway protein J